MKKTKREIKSDSENCIFSKRKKAIEIGKPYIVCKYNYKNSLITKCFIGRKAKALILSVQKILPELSNLNAAQKPYALVPFSSEVSGLKKLGILYNIKQVKPKFGSPYNVYSLVTNISILDFGGFRHE